MSAGPRILVGWRRTVARLPFFLRALGYALRRRMYPGFRLWGAVGGLPAVLRLEAELGLTKTILVDGRAYSSPSLPGYPSRAFDAAVARGGLDFASAGTSRNRHIGQVILGISRECAYRCAHCYEHRNLQGGSAVPLERWTEVIGQLQDAGVGVIVLSGGEPMLRFEGVLELLRRADKDRSEFHLHTSGDGVTPERARALKAAGLAVAAVGLDDVDEARFDALRGAPGAYQRACSALRSFSEAGLLACTNLCLTPGFVRSGGLPRYLELVWGLGVGLVQLLEPRPCGGYFGRDPGDLLEESDRQAVRAFVREANAAPRWADHPLLYPLAEVERSPSIGCTMGGISHFAIDSAGQVVPCVFAHVSFGSILTEDLAPILARMRETIPRPIHAGCPSVLLQNRLERLAEGGTRTPAYAELASDWHLRLYGGGPG